MTAIPKGLCQCGCGQRTSIATTSNATRGLVRGEPVRFVHGHHARVREHNGNWKGGRRVDSHGYVRILVPDHPRADPRGYVAEHVVVAEEALGKPLPDGAEVHHVNRVRNDNRNRNLVICEDNAYHSLIERRQRALDACGNASWLFCRFCHEYDAPGNLWIDKKRPSRAHHPACASEYSRQRRKAVAR